MKINFILCDPKQELTKKWKFYIDKYLSATEKQNFEIIHGTLEDYKKNFDCIVSPANSFGIMDGSFDLAISNMFSNNTSISPVIEHVQDHLNNKYNGFQIPGTCEIIPMYQFPNSHKCNWLAHVPTMVLPSNVTWYKQIVYNCMWSILCSLHNQDKIRSVFITGLATGVGGVPCDVAANQMILAYKHFVQNLNKKHTSTSWFESQQMYLDVDETTRLQKEMY